jgi:prevent-host-death family protein
MQLVRTTGIRELKNQLSRFLRLVAAGETVLVTDRGKVVAQLLPPPAYLGVPEAAAHEALERLARAGRIRLGVGGPPSARPDADELPPPSEPVDLAGALDEVRGERS